MDTYGLPHKNLRRLFHYFYTHFKKEDTEAWELNDLFKIKHLVGVRATIQMSSI